MTNEEAKDPLVYGLSMEQRAEQYKVCMERGHSSSNTMLTVNPAMDVCKFCGTHYRYGDPQLIESNLPFTREPRP